MKIKLLSDIHLEGSSFDSSQIAYDEKGKLVDVLILAGDISVYPDLIDRHTYNIPESVQVIYVPGNHEYEVKVFNNVVPNLQEMFNFPNWHILNNKTLVLGDVRFICSTLWSDLKIDGNKGFLENYEQAQLIIKKQETKVLDSHGSLREWGIEDMLKEFEVSCNFLESEINKPFDGQTVVVTHFAPSVLSAEKKYKNKGFWVSNLEYLMEGVDLWCHGHIHSSNNYKIGDTHILSNPRGHSVTYDLPQNVTFNKDLTVEVSPKSKKIKIK